MSATNKRDEFEENERARITFFWLVCHIISFYSNKFFILFSLFSAQTHILGSFLSLVHKREHNDALAVCQIDLLCVQHNFRALRVRIFVCSLFIFEFYIVMVFTTTWTDISITCYISTFPQSSELYWYLMTFNFLGATTLRIQWTFQYYQNGIGEWKRGKTN